MLKALMIVALIFWIAFAYECEGALFFHHVAKSEVSKICTILRCTTVQVIQIIFAK